MSNTKEFIKTTAPWLVVCYKKAVYLKNLFMNPQQCALERYIEAGGEALRIDYEIHPDEVIFDLGGYKGDWTFDMLSKHGNISSYVFEPVAEFSQKIKDRFAQNKKVHVFSFGLENETREELLYLSNDGSSSYNSQALVAAKKEVEKIHYISVSEFFKEHSEINDIAVMKINIEGGEYDLLEGMLKNNLVNRVKNFQIQFHNIPSLQAKERRDAIRAELSKTHTQTWCYDPWIWENWERKK